MTSHNGEPYPSHAGFFGKLPAHGDFIQRHLPASFTSPWDNWLQVSINASHSALKEQWLDTFITSPIWRWALSPGLLDDAAWLGVLLPSVDAVGRYFPFCFALRLPPETALIPTFFHNGPWFQAHEALGLRALEQALDASAIEAELPLHSCHPIDSAIAREDDDFMLYREAPPPHQIGASDLLAAMIARYSTQFSFWQTSGSIRVPVSAQLFTQLPTPKQFTTMLDSQWQRQDDG